MPTALVPAFGWRFLRHARYGACGPLVAVRSYSPPSGFSAKTIQISRPFDEARDGRVRAVVIRQQVQGVERLFDGHVLAGMVEGVEQDLGLSLVHRDVVADLRRPDGPAQVAGPEPEDIDDRRFGRLDGLDVGLRLGVVVIGAVPRREAGCGGRAGSRCEDDRREERGGGDDSGEGT